jgi:MFS family permease
MAKKAFRLTASAPTLVGLLAVAILLNYVDRGAIAVGAPLLTRELGLSATEFGLAVSAFFWVYVPMVLVAGWLCDRLCVYRLLAAGLALWALATALTSLVAGLATLVLLRVLLGVGESIAFPGASKVIVRHVPPERRSIANASLSVAIAIGPAIGTFVGGMIMVEFGWRAMFAVFGIVTLLWLVPWLIATKPLMSEPFRAGRERPFPPSRLFGQTALWATAVGHFLSNYGLYFMLTWLPLYLVSVRGLSIERMALLTATVFLAQAAFAAFWGWLCDHLIGRGVTEDAVRRSMLSLGHAGMTICTMGIYLAAGESVLFVWLVAWAATFSMTSPNLYATSQTFAGTRATGSWIGVQNAIANVAGIVGPVITGFIIDRTGSYIGAFGLAAGVTATAAGWYWLAIPRIRPLAIE